MNTGTAGNLTAWEIAQLRADVVSLITTDTTAVAVTVTTPDAAGTFDPASGAYTPAGVVDTVQGWMAPLTLAEVGEIPAAQVGDQRVLVTYEDLSIPPVKDTVLAVEGVNFAVVAVEVAPLSTYYEFIARRV